MSDFKLYQPEQVKKVGECKCGKCGAWPELFHAKRATDTNYPTIEQAKKAQLDHQGSVLIEENIYNRSYINHTTGARWKYNGSKYQQVSNNEL